jgi:osmotically-inducible protein OsmY
MRIELVLALLAAGAAAALQGCVPAVVGAGATAGVAVAQERSVGSAIDDATIELNVNSALLQKSESLFSKVGVESVEGRVLLTGAVLTPEDRVEAGRLAWTVDGVKEVLNEVEVTDKSSIVDYAKDAWITTQLRGKLIGDRLVSDINYSIETVNGVIYLMGIAQNEAELQRVTGHARTIRGVNRVVSHVRLKNDPDRS